MSYTAFCTVGPFPYTPDDAINSGPGTRLWDSNLAKMTNFKVPVQQQYFLGKGYN